MRKPPLVRGPSIPRSFVSPNGTSEYAMNRRQVTLRTRRSVIPSSSWAGVLAATTGALLLVGCASHTRSQSLAYDDQARTGADDRALITCVLPGQIRRLGEMTYLSSSRVVTTSPKDCEIRGG